MKFDNWGEIINDKNTYQDIAQKLKSYGRILIGWTDGFGTHFDILFVISPDIAGHIQGGLKYTDLFVSIMRVGAFGFIIDNKDIHYSYIGEKLNLGNDITIEKVAELINGIKKELCYMLTKNE